MSSFPGAPSLSTPKQPVLAWPTVLLFLGAVGLYAGFTRLGIEAVVPCGVAISVNTLSAYGLFTVLHDASHRAVSRHDWVNDWLGRLSIATLLPLPIFKAFRFIHMQHHRFANESADSDPDAYTSEGPKWLLPLRWATLDLKYMVFYLGRFTSRPAAERRESLLALLLGVALMGALVEAGYGTALVLYWLIPSRLAIFFLSLAFDYLPHHPKKTTQQENPWQATNNRVGLEWLMTPLLLSQNYHLVHHLYPRLPFYRYLPLWRAGEAEFLRHRPLLLDWRGREIPARTARNPDS